MMWSTSCSFQADARLLEPHTGLSSRMTDTNTHTLTHTRTHTHTCSQVFERQSDRHTHTHAHTHTHMLTGVWAQSDRHKHTHTRTHTHRHTHTHTHTGVWAPEWQASWAVISWIAAGDEGQGKKINTSEITVGDLRSNSLCIAKQRMGASGFKTRALLTVSMNVKRYLWGQQMLHMVG